MRATNGRFDSCKSCTRLTPSRSHESKLSFVSRIEFIRSRLSKFSAYVSGVTGRIKAGAGTGRRGVQWSRGATVA